MLLDKGDFPNICILCVRVRINKCSFEPVYIWIFCFVFLSFFGVCVCGGGGGGGGGAGRGREKREDARLCVRVCDSVRVCASVDVGEGGGGGVERDT